MDISRKSLTAIGASLVLGAATGAAASETISYSYDAHGRLIRAARSGSINNGVTTQYSHDLADNRTVRWTGTGTPPAPPALQPPAFSVGDAGAMGESHNFTFVVTRYGSINSSYNVNFAAAPGTAAAGVDYINTSGTLVFGPDDFFRTVTVTSTYDGTFEPDETFFLTLSNASGGAQISDGQGQATILNDDPPSAPPTAVNDTGPQAQICGGGVTVNVIANDTDPGGHYPLSLHGIVSATRGTAYVASSTHVGFSPESTGLATIVYRVQNSLGVTGQGTLYIQVVGQTPCL